jgi:hypothetical protein
MTNPPYATPSPGTYGAPAPSAPIRRNTAGTISLVLGILALVWGVVQIVWQAMAIASSEPSSLSQVSLINLVVGSLLAITGIAFGIAGLAAPGRSKVAAGIGTGIAISGLAGAVGSLLWPLIVQLLTR